MREVLAIAAVGAALVAGAPAANAETCMVKDQIPVPCAGHYAAPRYAAPRAQVYAAPAYGYEAPVYAAPAYGYSAPVYDDYYGGGYYDEGYSDNGYYGYYGAPVFAPSITFGGFFGGDDFGHQHGHSHGGGHRWHHRH
jgi:hypothetical protein